MERAIILADSGGSKTDWVIINSKREETTFQTGSYHPQVMSDSWMQQQQIFWQEITSQFEPTVFFYGAGCLTESGKSKVENTFKTFGINEVYVFSDLIGATLAVHGSMTGLTAICGTGSSVCLAEDGKIQELFGGYGYILGDEGSGFYAGKILLQEYLGNRLSPDFSFLIHKQTGTRAEIIEQTYSDNGKQFIAELSKIKHPEMEQFHRKNMQLFVDNYLPEKLSGQPIGFVGSYAFHNQKLLIKVLNENGWTVGKIVKSPIEGITDYWIKMLF